MLGSLFLDPATAGPLWARWWVAADQPDRRSFRLVRAPTETGPAPLLWREQALTPFAVLSTVERRATASDGDVREACADVLLIPPIAGGFPFILRDMAAVLAARRTVHVIEWVNPRRIAGNAGPFGIAEQVETVAMAAAALARPAHWIAVCQAGPAALIAAAGGPTPPRTVTVIGAPVDVDAAPSPIAALIRSHPRAFYERQLIRRPSGRQVFPAESQRAALYGMMASQSPERHEFARLIRHDSGADPRALPFLELVTSLMDQPAELYMQTIDRVFLAPSAPCAGLEHRGAPVDPGALAATPLLTIEGEADLVAAPGQTAAALALFPAARAALRRGVVIEGTGHFGLFYGAAWRRSVAPRVFDFLAAFDAPVEQASGGGRTTRRKRR